jgi:hypothetical protein
VLERFHRAPQYCDPYGVRPALGPQYDRVDAERYEGANLRTRTTRVGVRYTHARAWPETLLPLGGELLRKRDQRQASKQPDDEPGDLRMHTYNGYNRYARFASPYASAVAISRASVMSMMWRATRLAR